jgi:hypothetical protein
MARRREQADEVPHDQPATTEPPQQSGDRLQYAQEKLARMEEAQKICFKHQNDFAFIAAELQKLRFSDYEINQLLEPKGPRSLPGYLKSEIERQKQYVNYLTARVKPAESHAAALEQSQHREEERAL